MSIHTYPAAERRQPTETETERDRRTGAPPAADPPEPNEATADTDSWVARCQRQFDSSRTDRLRNCVDDESHAMPNPSDP